MKESFVKIREGKIVPKVGKTAKYISAFIRAMLEEHKLPLSKEQFIVLHHLEEEDKPQSFLAMITERDKGSLTRLVQSLEKKKLVVRKVCPNDSRVNRVSLTQEGRTILEQSKPIFKQVFDLVEKGITEEEKETVRRVLLQLRENAVAEMEKLENRKETP